MQLEFANQTSNPDHKEIFELCVEVVSSLAEPVFQDTEVSIVLVSEAEIQRLNREYRDKDAVTDVLSFPLWAERSELFPGSSLGEIVICYNKAYEQAHHLGHSLEYELCSLGVHGLWHIMGYDHISDEDFEQMNAKEKESLLLITQKVSFS